MAQAVEDVVGKRVKVGRFRLSNYAGFEVRDGGDRFRFCTLSGDFWGMAPDAYRELAAELTAIADAMEFGKVGVAQEAPVERSETPLVFTVRSEGWPRLGLFNSGALAFFHTDDGKPATVLDPRGAHYEVGHRAPMPVCRLLPKDGVLIHQQEGDSFPKLGLANTGELCLFERQMDFDFGPGYVVAPKNAGYGVGHKFSGWSYNPLPAGGVLLKPEA